MIKIQVTADVDYTTDVS